MQVGGSRGKSRKQKHGHGAVAGSSWRQQKVIAADLDMAPSQLARKLAQSPGDSARFTLDDLEAYLRTTGDTAPVLYLVDKYLRQTDRDELLRRIAELEGQLLAATPMRRDGRG